MLSRRYLPVPGTMSTEASQAPVTVACVRNSNPRKQVRFTKRTRSLMFSEMKRTTLSDTIQLAGERRRSYQTSEDRSHPWSPRPTFVGAETCGWLRINRPWPVPYLLRRHTVFCRFDGVSRYFLCTLDRDALMDFQIRHPDTHNTSIPRSSTGSSRSR